MTLCWHNSEQKTRIQYTTKEVEKNEQESFWKVYQGDGRLAGAKEKDFFTRYGCWNWTTTIYCCPIVSSFPNLWIALNQKIDKLKKKK